MDLDYSSFCNRLTSFNELSWPPESPVFIKELVEAGFSYTGEGDVVFCYQCGATVGNWLEDDDALERHKQLSEDCVFLKKRSASLAGYEEDYVFDECENDTFIHVKGRGVIKKSKVDEEDERTPVYQSKVQMYSSQVLEAHQVEEEEDTNRSFSTSCGFTKPVPSEKTDIINNKNNNNNIELDIDINKLKLSDEYSDTLPSPNIVVTTSVHPTSDLRPYTTIAGFCPTNSTSTGFHPTYSTTTGFRPTNSTSTGFHPTNYRCNDFHPTNSTSTDFHPTNSTSTDFHPTNSTSTDFHPTNSTSTDFHPTNSSSTDFYPTNSGTTNFISTRNEEQHIFEEQHRNAPSNPPSAYFRLHSEAPPRHHHYPGTIQADYRRSRSYPPNIENMNGTVVTAQIPVDLSIYSTRLKTFLTYPKDAEVQPVELAEAGFYYVNRQDLVKCFKCNVLLGQWKRGDAAWTEHCRYSPNCELVKLKQGGNVAPQHLQYPQMNYRMQSEAMDPRFIPPRFIPPRPPDPQNHILQDNPPDLQYYRQDSPQDLQYFNQNQNIVQEPNYTRRDIPPLPQPQQYYRHDHPNIPPHRRISNEHCPSPTNQMYPNELEQQHPFVGGNMGQPFQETSHMGYPRRYVRQMTTPNYPYQENNYAIQERQESINCPVTLIDRNIDTNYFRNGPVHLGSLSPTSNYHQESSYRNVTPNKCEAKLTASDYLRLSEQVIYQQNDEMERHQISTQEINTNYGKPHKQSNFSPPQYIANDTDQRVSRDPGGDLAYIGVCRNQSKDGNTSDARSPSERCGDIGLINDDDLKNCKICMDAAVEITFVPCGHLVVCSSCSIGLTMCPICRKDVTNSQRTYFYGN